MFSKLDVNYKVISPAYFVYGFVYFVRTLQIFTNNVTGVKCVFNIVLSPQCKLDDISKTCNSYSLNICIVTTCVKFL